MDQYGTLGALQPLLRSMGLVMERCKRCPSEEFRFFIKTDDGINVSISKASRDFRYGYTLREILNWLYLTAETSISQNAQALLSQLSDGTQGAESYAKRADYR